MRIARLVAAAVAATALVVVTTGGPACAHNSLTKAVPGKNATVKKPPAEVELTFLQKVAARSLTLVVTDSSNRKVPAEAPEASGKKATLTFTDDLPNGTYKVAYRVVSEDGHPVQGSYLFAVFAPGGETKSEVPGATAPSKSASPVPAVSSTSPAAVPATVAASDTSDGGTNWTLIVSITAAVAVLVAGALLFARRRKTP
jgi:methionine-rich copper-binding protein CopC